MHKNRVKYYFRFEKYPKIEIDIYYEQLLDLLKHYLDEDIYLEAEELLNSEINAKVETYFWAGFRTGSKYSSNLK